MKLNIKVFIIILISSIFPLGIGILIGVVNLNLGTLLPVILSLFLASSAAFLLSSQLSSSVKKIVNSISLIKAGHFNQLVDIRSKDELEEIAQNLNQLSQKLGACFSKTGQEKDILSYHNNLLNIVLSSIPDGIIALDLSKKVVIVNQTALSLTGYQASEITGQVIDKLMHFYDQEDEILPSSYCPTNLNIESGLIYHSKNPLRFEGKQGKQTFIQLLSSHIQGNPQTNLGCILLLHDISKEEGLEQMKLDFVSMASHELRTPLTSIIGYLSVFIEENKSKLTGEQVMFLDRIFVSAKQIATLIENLLNVSKIERGMLAVSMAPVDWQAQVTKVVGDLQNQAKLKNITLILHLPDKTLPKVMADPIRINEVVGNLITNAINYTKEGGKVDVSIETNPSEVITSVQDTGVGIPKEAIPHLFNKFFRVSGNLGQSSKGTGLGLYISKSIIDRHKGRIWVESEEGKGSKFSFSLPQASSHSQTPIVNAGLILPIN